jgi:hypothetical protein
MTTTPQKSVTMTRVSSTPQMIVRDIRLGYRSLPHPPGRMSREKESSGKQSIEDGCVFSAHHNIN